MKLDLRKSENLYELGLFIICLALWKLFSFWAVVLVFGVYFTIEGARLSYLADRQQGEGE